MDHGQMNGICHQKRIKDTLHTIHTFQSIIDSYCVKHPKFVKLTKPLLNKEENRILDISRGKPIKIAQ